MGAAAVWKDESGRVIKLKVETEAEASATATKLGHANNLAELENQKKTPTARWNSTMWDYTNNVQVYAAFPHIRLYPEVGSHFFCTVSKHLLHSY